jgi:hypothetical protein
MDNPWLIILVKINICVVAVLVWLHGALVTGYLKKNILPTAVDAAATWEYKGYCELGEHNFEGYRSRHFRQGWTEKQ